MKTKIILGSFLAMTIVSQSQTNTFPTSGNAGIGTLSPAYKLDIVTTTPSDGIRMRQTSYGACGLTMDNQTTGGKNWSLFSLGIGDAAGAGNFSIFHNVTSSSGFHRLFIQGSNGNVGIGSTTPAEKLTVVTDATNDGISVNQTASGASAAHLYNSTSGGRHWAIFSTGAGNSQGSGNFSIFQYGATDRLFINGATGNVGIGTINPSNGKFEVQENTGTNAVAGVFQKSVFDNGQNVGIYASADHGTYNWAATFVAGSLAGSTNVQNIGVFAATPVPYRNNVDWAGYFEGNVHITNNLSVGGIGTIPGGIWTSSDRKLKKEIRAISNSLDILMKLQPKTYLFDENSSAGLILPVTQQYGFIAQELQEVLPSLVMEAVKPAEIDSKGKTLREEFKYLSVQYDGIIPFLVKGIQEQQQQIEELKRQNSEMSKKLGLVNGIENTNTIETGFQMSQNEPNPFTHETVVKYTLPQSVGNAFMAVYDLTGKQITTFPIEQRGSASVSLTSEKLAAGIYIYSIVADGKVIDSKRMIVAEK